MSVPQRPAGSAGKSTRQPASSNVIRFPRRAPSVPLVQPISLDCRRWLRLSTLRFCVGVGLLAVFAFVFTVAAAAGSL